MNVGLLLSLWKTGWGCGFQMYNSVDIRFRRSYREERRDQRSLCRYGEAGLTVGSGARWWLARMWIGPKVWRKNETGNNSPNGVWRCEGRLCGVGVVATVVVAGSKGWTQKRCVE